MDLTATTLGAENGVEFQSEDGCESRVRLLRVRQAETHEEIDDWSVAVQLTGRTEDHSTDADRSTKITADTLKDAVYLLARRSAVENIEAFAQELIDYLLSRSPEVSGAEVTIESHLWKRLAIKGEPHPASFMKGSDERQTTRITRSRTTAYAIRNGFSDMTLLNAAQPGLAGVVRDELTGAVESTKRPFGMTITAEWTYTAEAVAAAPAFEQLRHQIRERIIATFAQNGSMSGQQLLEAMAASALERTEAIEDISLRMRERHLHRIDVPGAGTGSPNQVFVPAEEGHSKIEVTVRRS